MFAVQGNTVVPIVGGRRAPPIDLTGLLELVKAKQAAQNVRRRGLLGSLAAALGAGERRAGGAGAGAGGARRGLLQGGGAILAISSLDYDGSTLWLVLSNGCAGGWRLAFRCQCGLDVLPRRPPSTRFVCHRSTPAPPPLPSAATSTATWPPASAGRRSPPRAPPAPWSSTSWVGGRGQPRRGAAHLPVLHSQLLPAGRPCPKSGGAAAWRPSRPRTRLLCPPRLPLQAPPSSSTRPAPRCCAGARRRRAASAAGPRPAAAPRWPPAACAACWRSCVPTRFTCWTAPVGAAPRRAAPLSPLRPACSQTPPVVTARRASAPGRPHSLATVARLPPAARPADARGAAFRPLRGLSACSLAFDTADFLWASLYEGVRLHGRGGCMGGWLAGWLPRRRRLAVRLAVQPGGVPGSVASGRVAVLHGAQPGASLRAQAPGGVAAMGRGGAAGSRAVAEADPRRPRARSRQGACSGVAYVLPRELEAQVSGAGGGSLLVRQAHPASCDELEAGEHGVGDAVELYCFKAATDEVTSECRVGAG